MRKPKHLNSLVGLYFFLTVLLVFPSPSKAQPISAKTVTDLHNNFQEVVGLDQNLINGYQYINHYPKAKNHAYFGNDEFLPGRIVVNDFVYNKVNLKYDIYNQHILLQYINSYGGLNQIVIQNKAIKEFELGGKVFSKINFPNMGEQFYQIVADRDIQCIYYWQKKISIAGGSVDNFYEYSKQTKKTFLVMDGKIFQYRGKKSFLNLFPISQQTKIKNYIAINKIKLTKASDATMDKLIEYCVELKKQIDSE